MIASKPGWLSSVAALAVAGCLSVPGPAAAAGGLFEFLGSVFGGRPAPPAYEDMGGGLDLTVHPQRRVRSIRRRETSAAKPANTAINPVDHPNWYLEDPTLRRGDIVVLPGKVLVYEGGRGQAEQADFTSINRSSLVSKADRQKVGAMTGLMTGLPLATPSRSASGSEPAPSRRAAALGGND